VDSVSGVPGSKAPRRYRFADLTFDVGQRRLWRADGAIPLSKLSYELMRVLVEAAPNLVTHDELATRVWGPRRIVTPENLAKRVMMLRQAIGDQVDAPRYVEGIRGQGYRLIPDVEIVDSGPRAESPQEARRLWNVRYALAGLVFIGLGLVAVEQYASRATGSVAQRSSIAVLPCENHSATNENAAFLGAGLRNELLTQLHKIGALNVVERTPAAPSSTELRGPSEIGRELGAASILECTVQRAGDALRVYARLFDTPTGRQLWAESYEREFTTENIFAIQRDIATSITSVLKIRLTPQEAERLAARPTNNIRAYELYLAATTREVMTAGDQTRAIELLDEALKIDPDFAEAWAAKAGSQAEFLAFSPPAQAAELGAAARRGAKRAVDLRPESIFVRAINALVLDRLGDWVEAEREYRAAFDLGGRRGNRAYVLHNVSVGYFEEARRNVEAMLERAPIDPVGLAYLLAIHGLLGETDQEEEIFARGNALHGDAWFGGLHEFYLRLGRTRTVDASLPKRPASHDLSVYLDSPGEGVAEIARLAQTEGSFETNVGKIHLALWAAFFGDDDLAMQLLAAAFEHTGMNTWFIWMPLFHETRQHPDFERLLLDLGLVEYWDEFGWPSICRRIDDRIECD
jgi:TolB-like protein/DNA-binding winged helix-turn-helix (wHTH) protein